MEEGPCSLHETLCPLPLSLQFILDTKFWTALSFLMVTASLLLFCFFSFLTQSIDAFRIAPAIFRFPGEMPRGSPWPGLGVSYLVGHLFITTSQSCCLEF